jgi:hypothetical protein
MAKKRAIPSEVELESLYENVGRLSDLLKEELAVIDHPRLMSNGAIMYVPIFLTC